MQLRRGFLHLIPSFLCLLSISACQWLRHARGARRERHGTAQDRLEHGECRIIERCGCSFSTE